VCDRDLIARGHLPTDFGRTHATAASELSSLRFPLGTTVDAMERELILQTLAATNNKTRAAELLGISLKTLHNKLKEYEAGRAENR
jgi:transcriptional regulator with PAS, ATPase and Fis domain